jgi:rhodanese-related sulfurtransferase
MKVFRKCVKEQSLLVDITASSQLDKNMLFDKQIFILDVRPQYMRNKLKSLPNSHEVPFFSLGKYLDQFPKDKHILAVCQHGNLSYIATTYLKSKGFDQVSSLSSGMVGWKGHYGELYEEYAGQNITVLQPTG